MNIRYKVLILLLIPLVYGFLVTETLSVMPPLFSQLIFGVLWVWTGFKCTKLPVSKTAAFLIGNSLWLVSFMLFMWQFYVLDDMHRNLMLAGISQWYMFSFLWSGIHWTLLYTYVLQGNLIISFSYIAMFFVFAVGFAFGLVNQIWRGKVTGA